MAERSRSKPSPLEKFLGSAQAAWTAVVQGAAWLCGIVAGFLLPPQFEGRIVGAAISVENLSRLVQLIVAILIGLLFVTTRRSKLRRSVRFWVASTVVTLILGLGFYYLYVDLLDSWTCRYSGTRVVIGSELTTHGSIYMQGNSNRSCEAWIYDHAGEVEAIWTTRSIRRQEISLLLTYIVAVPLFAFCIMSLVQALGEGTRRKS